MTRKDDKGWAGEDRLAIGRALLRLHPQPSTARELAEATGKDRSNVGRTVESMAAADLLVRERPPRHRSGPGRQPKWAYRLADSEKEKLERSLTISANPGALRKGQQLVLAAATGPRFAELLEAIVDAEAASQLAWSALIDGDPQECLAAFEGSTAVSLANELVAVLSRAGIPSRRVTVAQVSIGHEFLEEANRATRSATGTAIRLATRRASAG
jgi:DNA-binding MarR family transcriptional regulator